MENKNVISSDMDWFVVQSLSHVWLFTTPWTAACQAPVLHCLPRSVHNHLILCCPFSFCLQTFSASGSFPMSQFFASGGQSIGASASASVLPMNILDWFPLGLTGLILLERSRDFQESSPTPQFKSISSSVLSFLYSPALTFMHDYWKNHTFD